MTGEAERRFGAVDVVLLLALAAGLGWLSWRAAVVVDYRWNWPSILEYVVRWDEEKGRYVANILVQGFLTTCRLAVWSILLAAPVGVAFGLMRCAGRLYPRLLSRTYVELVRNIPPLVFLFIFYFFVSSQVMPALGVDGFVRGASPATLQVIDILFCRPAQFTSFLSGVITLALFEAAYITEIVRAGVQSIDRGQWDAARSLGLNRVQVLRLVILPLAIARVLPPLAGQFIALVKDSSIVSIVSVQELTFMSNEVAVSTNRFFEVWLIASALYFCVCYALSLLFGRLEARLRR